MQYVQGSYHQQGESRFWMEMLSSLSLLGQGSLRRATAESCALRFHLLAFAV